MLDFIPYFQIVIGLYISFCFEKLIQSLLWNEEFTAGLRQFYKDWGTLAWHNDGGEEENVLQQSIEKSIKSYVTRTKRLGLFMLLSVSTMLLSYCWVGKHCIHNDQLMVAYSIWNIAFFVLIFIRKIWIKWWNIVGVYLFLLILTIVVMWSLIVNGFTISHSCKVVLAIVNLSAITFPLVVELFRARIRSDYFLDYLRSCRDKFSQRCSSLLLAIVNDGYKDSKYLLQLKDTNLSSIKDGDVLDKGKLLAMLMGNILCASEKQALKILAEDCRTTKILLYCRFKSHYCFVKLENLNSEEELFKLNFVKAKQ